MMLMNTSTLKSSQTKMTFGSTKKNDRNIYKEWEPGPKILEEDEETQI